nr:MAG TPA: hypothetical protein [Caudoviricetes sp.]
MFEFEGKNAIIKTFYLNTLRNAESCCYSR